MAWMIIRVRGTIHANRPIVETLARLHLERPNHATVVPESKVYRGMLARVQGYVTWGEADAATVSELVGKRGRDAAGETPKEVAPIAQRVLAQGLAGTEGIRPIFRLHPPKGGWRSTKKPFALGGALGYRGAAINELARKML
jgi:large subunit ribosomal protein L30